MKSSQLKKASYLVILALLFILLGLIALLISLPDGKLHLKVYDVGQGDSIFIRTAAGYKILVDGGPDNKVIDHLSKDLAPWDRKIDYVILTHPQSDHMYGLIEVVKRYQIGTLIYSGVENTTKDYQNWKKVVEEKRIEKIIAVQGDKLVFPDKTEISFLWPEERNPIVKDLNQAAVVFTLNFGSFSSLLTGDADSVVQPYTSTTSHVEVLKVPHHGSKTALKEDFIKALSPTISIVSSGANNSYGHPNPILLKMLENVRTKVYRTDQNGSVEVVADEKSWYTKTEKGN